MAQAGFRHRLSNSLDRVGLGTIAPSAFMPGVEEVLRMSLRPLYPMPRRVAEKPWGREIYIAETPYYVAKIVYINPNESMSMHYHVQRHETLYFQTPDCTLEVEGEEPITPDVGEAFAISPGVKHRLAAGPLGGRIFEVSTPHPDDVVRVEDPWSKFRYTEKREEPEHKA